MFNSKSVSAITVAAAPVAVDLCECGGGAYRARKRAMRQLEKFLLDTRSNRIAQKHPHPKIAIAIPVCNELERIDRCVEALANQRDRAGALLGRGCIRVVLLANSCTDGTYEHILKNLERWRVAVTAFNIRLPASRQHAGGARRMANHAALDVLPERGGLLFMTDADSAVPADWVARHAAILRGGYDAVAGLIHLHPDDCSEILPGLLERRELENRYSDLLDRIECLIDPVAHDPWPRHYNASGANMAVRADSLRGMGDFPQIACGEDRLFVRMLEAQGKKVRHDCENRVFTSGRLFGRAAGGMADTLRHRLRVPDAACDPRLEFADRAYQRASLRKQLRMAWPERNSLASAAKAWADQLALDVSPAIQGAASKTFEDAWQKLEAVSPLLKRRPVSPCHLPAEILRAECHVHSLVSGGPIDVPLESHAMFA